MGERMGEMNEEFKMAKRGDWVSGIKPGKLTHLEILKPDPDLIRLTELIINQNKIILDMNARLLSALASPLAIAHMGEDFEKKPR